MLLPTSLLSSPSDVTSVKPHATVARLLEAVPLVPLDHPVNPEAVVWTEHLVSLADQVHQASPWLSLMTSLVAASVALLALPEDPVLLVPPDPVDALVDLAALDQPACQEDLEVKERKVAQEALVALETLAALEPLANPASNTHPEHPDNLEALVVLDLKVHLASPEDQEDPVTMADPVGLVDPVILDVPERWVDQESRAQTVCLDRTPRIALARHAHLHTREAATTVTTITTVAIAVACTPRQQTKPLFCQSNNFFEEIKHLYRICRYKQSKLLKQLIWKTQEEEKNLLLGMSSKLITFVYED